MICKMRRNEINNFLHKFLATTIKGKNELRHYYSYYETDTDTMKNDTNHNVLTRFFL